VCLHLNNTVFVDRAMIVQPYNGNSLPDEMEGLRVAQQQQVGALQHLAEVSLVSRALSQNSVVQ
jgi:hypothetical protein